MVIPLVDQESPRFRGPARILESDASSSPDVALVSEIEVRGSMTRQVQGLRTLFRDAARQSPILTAVLSLILVMTGFRLIWHAWARKELSTDFPEGYLGIWYFVDYSQGFVRRGFVGEILTTLGLSENLTLVQILSRVLAFLALLLLVLLALKLALQLPQGVEPLVVFTLVAASPLYVLSIIRDPGRLDNVAILAGFALYALSRYTTLHAWTSIALSSVLFVAATAAQELLFVYLLPFAIALHHSQFTKSQAVGVRRLLVLVLPASIVFILSLVYRAPSELIAYVARRTGSPSTSVDFGSPLWSLQQDLSGALEFTSSFPGHWLGVAVNGGAFVVSALALAFMLGRWRSSGLLIAYLALVTLVLSAVGVDSLRWWSLAFVTFVAVSFARASTTTTTRVEDPTVKILGTTCVGASIVLALLGNLPITGGSLLSWAGLYFQVLRS